jgi:hypothetical protein
MHLPIDTPASAHSAMICVARLEIEVERVVVPAFVYRSTLSTNVSVNLTYTFDF